MRRQLQHGPPTSTCAANFNMGRQLQHGAPTSTWGESETSIQCLPRVSFTAKVADRIQCSAHQRKRQWRSTGRAILPTTLKHTRLHSIPALTTPPTSTWDANFNMGRQLQHAQSQKPAFSVCHVCPSQPK